jgi:hypothetical protein
MGDGKVFKLIPLLLLCCMWISSLSAMAMDLFEIPFSAYVTQISSAVATALFLNRRRDPTIDDLLVYIIATLESTLAGNMFYNDTPKALCRDFIWNKNALVNGTHHHRIFTDEEICSGEINFMIFMMWFYSFAGMIVVMYTTFYITRKNCMEHKPIEYTPIGYLIPRGAYLLISIIALVVCTRETYSQVLPSSLLIIPAFVRTSHWNWNWIWTGNILHVFSILCILASCLLYFLKTSIDFTNGSILSVQLFLFCEHIYWLVYHNKKWPYNKLNEFQVNSRE